MKSQLEMQYSLRTTGIIRPRTYLICAGNFKGTFTTAVINIRLPQVTPVPELDKYKRRGCRLVRQALDMRFNK